MDHLPNIVVLESIVFILGWYLMSITIVTFNIVTVRPLLNKKPTVISHSINEKKDPDN